jgi:hypothetical protein
MSEAKFKVGDRVRVVTKSGNDPLIGKLGTVVESNDRDIYVLASIDGGEASNTWFARCNLELVEPAPVVKECLTTDSTQTTGKQAFIQARFDCIDPLALRLVAECVGFGARKYGEDNHKKISVLDHLNHAMNHINEHRTGDQSEMHLVHAIARLFFAVELVVQFGAMEDRYFHPDMTEGVLAEATSE